MSYTNSLKMLVVGSAIAEQQWHQLLQPDQSCPYRTVTCKTIPAALEWCQHDQPDVILLDLDGDRQRFTSLQQIRSQKNLAQVAVIVLAEQADFNAAVSAMRQGAQDYLVKANLTPSQLSKAISNAVERMNAFHPESVSQHQIAHNLAKETLRTQTLLNASFDGIVILYQNQVVEANLRFAEMLGYTLEEIKQLSVADWEAQWSPTELQQQISQWQTDGSCHRTFETRHRRKDGLVFDVEISTNDVKWEGKVFQFCVCRDISERKRLEAERLRAEQLHSELQLLENILEVTMAGYWDWDIPNHQEYLSPTFKHMFGYQDHELANSPDTWQQLIFPEDLPGVLACFEQHISSHGQLPYYNEVRYRHKNGSTVWVICAGRVIEWGPNDEPLRMVGCHIDITHRKQTEQLLQASEARYRAIVEDQSELIVRFLPDTTISFVNQAYCSYFGVRQEDLVGNSYGPVIFEGDRERVAHQVASINAENPSLTIENRVVVDGEVRWTQWSNRMLFDEQGQFVEFQAVGRDITELKQVEAQLLALNSLQQAILDAADYAIISTNENGTIQTFNAAAQQMLGYTAAEVVGRTTPDQLFHDPNELRQQAKSLSAALGQPVAPNFDVFVVRVQLELPSEAEWTYIRRDRSPFPVSLSITALRGAAGEIIGYLGIAKDITHQKQIDAELRKNAAHLATAQRIAALGSWEFDLTTQTILWSDEVFRIFDRDPQLGPPTYEELRQIIHPDDRIPHDQAVQHAVEMSDSYEIEFRIVRTDGAVRFLLARGEVLLDANGQSLRLVGTVLDITDRKLIEEERKQSEIQLRSLSDRLSLALQAGAIGTWDWDLIHEAHWDERMYEIYGLQHLTRAAIYQDWINLMHPDDRLKTEAALQAALYSNEGFNVEFRIIRPDGVLRHIKAAAMVQRNEQGEPIRMVGINYDISDRKLIEAELERRVAERTAKLQRAEKALRQANETLEERVQKRTRDLEALTVALQRSNRELEQFAYVASHDLQEPLRTITSYAQLFARKYQGNLDEKAEKYLYYMTDGASRMQQLIRDLLAYSRVGRYELKTEPVECNALLTEVKSNLQVAIAESHAHIQADPLPVVIGDRHQLLLLFQNLISNAIKYRSAAPPQITISAIQQDGYWQFSIQDNGIGIEPQYCDRIFVIFQRLHSRSEYPGTGLGLAIVKKIIERHGGMIEVKSELGYGSTFHFALPVQQPNDSISES